jgi:tetratricopeptide (TPR) repeat protein
MTLEQETIALAQPVPEHLEDAARLLEHALKVGPADPNVAYLLALCRKRQGNTAAARAALRKIAEPDANVCLQLGLLSFAEKQFPQAAEEFAHAGQLDPSSYEAAFNLLLTRLCLGEVEGSDAVITTLLPLAPSAEEHRFLTLLQALLRSALLPPRSGPPPLPGSAPVNGVGHPGAVLASITTAEAERLLRMLGGLGRFDALYPLMRVLAASIPTNQAVHEAHLEVVLVHAKELADRCDWAQAEQLLLPLLTSTPAGSPHHHALLNLLGCCACMLQDYDRAVHYFGSALIRAGNDPWLHQNLALTHEMQGRFDLANRHWSRYFDLLDPKKTRGASALPPVPLPHYVESLTFEGLSRLADLYSKKERWQTALGYLEQASALRPEDAEVLERLFHLYNQIRRPEDARRTLRRLRALKPGEPQFDLYELDVRDVRTLEDMDRTLTEIRRILAKYPNDMRVEEKAVGMVTNFLPLMGRMLDQLGSQLDSTVEQMRRLPNYQINWPAVHDVMRDLLRDFQKLRRLAGKCQSLVTSEEHRRTLRELNEQIDRRIELCQSMRG